MNSVFYTYLWLREDGTPYYVGKGCRNRAYTSCPGHRPPKDRSCIVVQGWANEHEALEAEILLIAIYGRKSLGTGCLRNLTDGGTGTTGPKSPEHREKLVAHLRRVRESLRGVPSKLRGTVLSAAHREKLSRSHLGKKLSLSQKVKIGNTLRGHIVSPATRESIRVAKTGQTFSTTQKENMRLAHLGKKHPHTPAWNEKIGQTMKARACTATK